MFDHTHYVPVLRWKRAERDALRDMENCLTKRMTPLVEVIPQNFSIKKDKDIEIARDVQRKKVKSKELIRQLRDSWAAHPHVSTFLDFQHLARIYPREDIELPIKFMGDSAATLGLSIIPVTGLRRGSHYQSAIASIIPTLGKGASIRLECQDLNDPKLTFKLQSVLKELGLTPTEVDLIVDYQLIEDEGYEDFKYLMATLPDTRDWRSFTVLSGSFPQDLRDISIGIKPQKRVEWEQWVDQVNKMQTLGRVPTFGDYTIQHAHYMEPIKGADVSASVRYTTNIEWLVCRGKSLRKEGSDQYPSHAVMLQDRAEFKGASFSKGDKYIASMMMLTTKPGNPEKWLWAGINHHLTFVIDQLANHFGSVIADAPAPSIP